MVVYISGPITGIRNNNRRGFAKAQGKICEALAGRQYLRIINPITIGQEVDRHFDIINESLYRKRKPKWSDYMWACIKKLAEATCVYFIKDWEKSKGANLEHSIAEALGTPCAETIEALLEIAKEADYDNSKHF